ncbi:unnamed protein product [Effrenium voratum]|nr:unnamed protein product [Effrenium voratum]
MRLRCLGLDEQCCRICRQGEEAGKLYCPCRCAGSIKWIHEACLQAWLKSHERKAACELCGYSFDFIPVYSKNAPHRLTLADWVGALCSSSWQVSIRVLRILYAIGLWGFLLPVLTITAARSMFGRARPEFNSAWHVLTLTLDIFIGECLSLAGIAFIYLLSFLTAVRGPVADPPGSEGSLPAAPEHEAQIPDQPESASVGIQVDTRQLVEDHDPEEDLLIIMGLSGNPVRSLLSMIIFLSANVAGIYSFLGLPSFLGRWAIRSAMPWIEASMPDFLILLTWSGESDEPRPSLLPAMGANILLDVLAVTVGYALVTVCAVGMILAILLPGALTGQTSRNWQALRMLVGVSQTQLSNVWWKLQHFAVAILQLVVLPAYVGHLVLCLLSGPVLHLSQHARASIMNAHPLLTLVMQLFIGYVHLWGFAFMEGCLAGVTLPEVVQRASLNFFVSAINCHRRLFGTMSEELGGREALPMPPHWATLKLALVHVAIHTPLVWLTWYLPAYLLDRLLGDALFPMLLVDQSGDVLEGLHRRDPFFLSSPASTRSSKPAGEGQSLFILELMQLYVLVLQCIRILETSPVMTKLISFGLRCALRGLGLKHFLVGENLPAEDPDAPDADGTVGDAEAKSQGLWCWVARGRVLGVVAAAVLCCWLVMAMVLGLPLALGRLMVRFILSSQAKRTSDFLPLSMGVVVASAWILVVVKLGEALPRILEQASALRRHRFLHILTCGVSALGLTLAALQWLQAAAAAEGPVRFPGPDC